MPNTAWPLSRSLAYDTLPSPVVTSGPPAALAMADASLCLRPYSFSAPQTAHSPHFLLPTRSLDVGEPGSISARSSPFPLVTSPTLRASNTLSTGWGPFLSSPGSPYPPCSHTNYHTKALPGHLMGISMSWCLLSPQVPRPLHISVTYATTLFLASSKYHLGPLFFSPPTPTHH